MIILEFLSEDIINSVFDFILEFQLIILSHLHFNSLGSFLIFIAKNFFFIEWFLHTFFIRHVFKALLIIFCLNFGCFVFLFEFQSFKSRKELIFIFSDMFVKIFSKRVHILWRGGVLNKLGLFFGLDGGLFLSYNFTFILFDFNGFDLKVIKSGDMNELIGVYTISF